QIPRLVGNFSSTVLLPLELDTAQPFGERAVATQRRLWQHIHHSRVSGIRVLRELARERGTALTAGAPVVFASNLNAGVEDAKEVAVAPEGARTLHSHLQTSQVWLDHQVFEIGGGLHFNWDAVEGLFPEGLVDDLFAAYRGLVVRLADESRAWEEPVRGLTPRVQVERFRRVNATTLELPRHRLEAVFRDSAERHPERPALVDGDGAWSYGQVAAAAAALAHRLKDRGVSPERPVAVVLPKGPWQAVATLGILAAAAPYLPIDPALPPQRLAHLLTRAGAILAVTRMGQEDLVWPEGVERVALTKRDAAAGMLPEPAGDDQALAYILYTSGSTGEPKGVAIPHRGAVNTLLDLNHRFEIGPEDRTLALSSLSFDLSVYDLFGTFAAGGAVVYPDAALDREPAHWLERLRGHGVTVWNSVPALAEMLVAHCEGRGEPLPPSLRLFLLSGDWIPVNLPDRIRALHPAARVISLGGATEASIWSIFHPIETVDPAASSIPYGRPLANQTFRVLDEIGEPRPQGVPGQLYIGGVGVARGYWQDPERTAAAFGEHPVTGERLYRTGDLGRWLETDEIEFLGREDSQVKIQGHRIELGEVEAVLEHHPAVRQAAAAALGDQRGAKRLVAYAVPVAGAAPEPAALTEFLADQLPTYMAPAHLMLLPALPLTANGKVDRSRLPSPETSEEGLRATAPRDEVERRLVALWQEVLGQAVGVTDDFFALGGQSLLAVRLMARIREAFGQELLLSVLLEGPTVEHLAACLRQGSQDPATSSLVAIRRHLAAATQPPFFCVHPSGGNVLCYRELAAALPGDRGFFGLQAPALAGAALPERLETLAATYLAAARHRQPEGPYLLGGWSMGGVVAFEMAQQLSRSGERGAVLLLDALAPDGGPPPAEEELTAAFARDTAELDAGDGVLPAAERQRLFAVFRANYLAMLRYTPTAFAGPVAVFRARNGLGSALADPSMGWRQWVHGPLVTYDLPGDHYALVRPPVSDQLAESLDQTLAWAQSHLR
ncbi:MAG: amino acid adenylation domain-containing protein, partial [bacterium]|nr:amino acid adenylation domain-containing protein [bacterium]